MVHITSGVSALVCALYLGKRLGYPEFPSKPHNLVISFIGACLLWVGWFGFNAGSALAASGLATSAFVATHFGAAAATLGWVAAEWLLSGKPSVLGGISGCVAGLVAITPASGFVKPFPALLIGLCAGVVCYLMVTRVKARFGYDDSLDAFGVHGAGGTLGALLTGVFATSAVNDGLKDAAGHTLPLGLVDGNGAPGAEPVHRLRHRLGAGHRGHARHSEDLRFDRGAARQQGAGDRGPGCQHARRRRVYIRVVTVRPVRITT